MTAHGIPFTIRRIVRWGECDPAGIVYTPRFLDYATEAVDDFVREVLGTTWYKLRHIDRGHPMVHASLDFYKPLAADDLFDLVVIVEHVGRSSIAYQIAGKNTDGELCFEAKMVGSIIQINGPADMKAIPIPDDMRERLEAYCKACLGKAKAAGD